MALYAIFVISSMYLLAVAPLMAASYLIGRYLLSSAALLMSVTLWLLLLPPLVYWALDRLGGKGKTLANGIAEPFCIGIAVGIVYFIRIVIVDKFLLNPIYASRISILISVVLSVAVYIFVPSIPE